MPNDNCLAKYSVRATPRFQLLDWIPAEGIADRGHSAFDATEYREMSEALVPRRIE